MTVYRVPEQHMCETWTAEGAVGSVWRCAGCGTYWKRHPAGLTRAGGWYIMGRFELWRFKRKQRTRGQP